MKPDAESLHGGLSGVGPEVVAAYDGTGAALHLSWLAIQPLAPKCGGTVENTAWYVGQLMSKQ